MNGTATGEAVIGKIRRCILPNLSLCFLVALLDRVNVGFVALQVNGDLSHPCRYSSYAY